MVISFLLPGLDKSPSGGYKIIYEYCNRLAEKGHVINLIYRTKNQFNYKILGRSLRRVFFNISKNLFPRWMKISNSVNKFILDDYIDMKDLPIADFIFATSVDTVELVEKMDEKYGVKGYFIQGFENWNRSDEYVIDTFKNEMIKIVVAGWLKQIVDEHSFNESYLISNPIDLEKFFIKNPIEQRIDPIVTCLYHTAQHKGGKDLIEALRIVKERIPNLKVNFFGVSKRPKNLENWISYTQNADEKQLLELYNEASIYACASINEGFGLTCVEAMACGCALVSTEFLGVFEYAVNGRNSLLSNTKDPKHLAENIIFLLENNLARYSIAYQGKKSVIDKDWKIAVDRFERILIENENY